MVTSHKFGFMIVKPDYSNEAAPDFIQVTVAYRNPIARNMSKAALEDVIEKAKSELAPDFTVMGNIEVHQGGKAIFIIISKE